MGGGGVVVNNNTMSGFFPKMLKLNDFSKSIFQDGFNEALIRKQLVFPITLLLQKKKKNRENSEIKPVMIVSNLWYSKR